MSRHVSCSAMCMIGTALLTLLALTGQTTPSQDARQATFAIQVGLDRACFSTGGIDGRMETNTDARSTPIVNGTAPSRRPSPIRSTIRITAEDEAGPFVSEIPHRPPRQSKLPALAYRFVVEALAVRFHTTPEVLRELNGSASFCGRPQHPRAQRRAARRPAPGRGRCEWRGGASHRHERSPSGCRQGPEGQAGRDGARQSNDWLSDRHRHRRQGAVLCPCYDRKPEQYHYRIGEWKVNGVQNDLPPLGSQPWTRLQASTKAHRFCACGGWPAGIGTCSLSNRPHRTGAPPSTAPTGTEPRGSTAPSMCSKWPAAGWWPA